MRLPSLIFSSALRSWNGQLGRAASRVMMASLPFSWISLSSRSKSNMPGPGRGRRRLGPVLAQSPNPRGVRQGIAAQRGRHEARNDQRRRLLAMRHEEMFPGREQPAAGEKKGHAQDNERAGREMLRRQQAQAVKRDP